MNDGAVLHGGLGAALRVAFDRHRWPLAAMLALAAVVTLWCHFSGLTIHGAFGVIGQAGITLAAGMAMESAAALAIAEAGGSAPWFARLAKMGEAIGGFAIWTALMAAIAVLSYLCAKLALPLYDARFIAVDHALGFDWLAWHGFVGRMPWLGVVFHLAYETLILQLIITFCVAALCADSQRLAEFRWITIVAAIITCVVSGLLPAIGAKPFYAIPGANWIADLELLRRPGPVAFDLINLNGIVTFPSFHTASGVLFMWSTRKTGLIGMAMVALNVVMIVSTLTEGGHYLVDVLAGIAVAVLSIALVRWGFGRRG